MICNICGKDTKTHEYEDLEVCDDCQKKIDEELKKPKAKPKNTNDNDDIYGSDEKGWWSGGSNLMGK